MNVTDSFGGEEGLEQEEDVFEAVISQLKIKASLLKMLATLYQFHLYSDSHHNTDTRVELIKASITFIRNHYREKIYIRDLASLANMNEQYFCRFFLKRPLAGLPPNTSMITGSERQLLCWRQPICRS